MLLFDTALITGIVVVMNTVGSKLVMAESAKLIEENGNYVVSQMSARLDKIEALTRTMANVGEVLPHEQALIRNTVRPMLDFDGDFDVAGGGLWFEPYVFDPELRRASFFWGRDERNQLVFFDEYNAPGPEFDESRFTTDELYRTSFLASPGYHNEEWYVVIPHIVEEGRSFWSGSYMDPYSYQPMVTVTVAMRDAESAFRGVATVDLKLEGLHELVTQWAGKTGGYLFLLDRDNRFITFPKPEIAKIYSRDGKGNLVEAFHTVTSFAEQEPRFRPMARELDALNRQLIDLSQANPYYTRQLVEAIDASSYQVDDHAAQMITAVMLDPYRERFPDTSLIHSVEVDDDLLLGQKVVVSVFHIPGAYWKAVIVKPFAEYGQVAGQIKMTILNYIFLIAVIIFILAFSYQFLFIVRPINRITRKAASIGHELQLGKSIGEIEDPQVNFRARGEIGRLAQAFNAMTSELVITQRQLVEINRNLEAKVEDRTRELETSQAIALQNAHAAGMAEIATGVVHNIGNVLNSLNVSVDQMVGELNENHAQGYQQAMKLLEANLDHIEQFLHQSKKGPILMKYLIDFGEVYETELTHLSETLVEMREKVQIIKQIIMTQQVYAKGVELYEEVDLAEVIDDALNLETPSLKKNGIHVVRDYQVVEPLRTSKVKLMHILINLIKNGREAMMAHKSDEEKRLVIELSSPDEGWLRIRVVDNGVGISKDNLAKIFSHGFTTKRGGNGFGLHFCANAAKELGGELTGRSDGLGRGAVFTLLLAVNDVVIS
ncbi:ATP-binding protein [Sulfidibacter corallicola]|uniref:histidine kinase n=1 Tax=Sulfidibacter corallicola TaxID=2818388 RepID=A0A8A4THM2_SULCO|nr:ATP-binding protein [Sulfidibacter corallicola]QTD49426.1 HAMP domain-containing protein [Sulfidibacter corallicola]